MRKKILRHQENHSVNFSFLPPIWSEDINKANQSIKQTTTNQNNNNKTPNTKISWDKKEKKIKREPGKHRCFKNVFNIFSSSNWKQTTLTLEKSLNFHHFLPSSFIICPLCNKDSRSKINSPSADRSWRKWLWTNVYLLASFIINLID